ncbi:MAG: hypothetical protein B6I18_09125 [Bacteroidetes bacterium 4572_112]|nr:MAG: hypothetical protein B6I18_09125 [Bacteroidetes bacterium 4572_112]
MKKVILTLLLGLIISLTSIAQVNKHNIGVFVGSGISSTYTFFDIGMGYDFGLSYTYRLHKNFAISTGLDYDIRSYSLSSTIETSSGVEEGFEFNNNFGFLSVPLLLNVNIGNKVKYFANAGVSLNYLLNYKQTSKIGEQTDVYYGKGYFNEFGIDLNIGIGVQFPLSDKVDLSVEARFKKGLIDIAKTPVEGSEKVTTSNALLLMGLHYKL